MEADRAIRDLGPMVTTRNHETADEAYERLERGEWHEDHRRNHQLVFLHVRSGVVVYTLGSICDHHPDVSLGDAWRRLETMRETDFESRDALNAAIRKAMTT